MVETPFNDIAGQLTSRIFGGILWFGIAMVVIGVLGFLMWYFLIYRKKFDIMVKIKSDRVNDPKIYFDYAAILVDRKDRTKYFRLRDTKVDLPVPPFNVLRTSNLGDYIEVWRKSEDEFIFLLEGKVDKYNIVKQDGTVHVIAEQEQKQIEGDIAFWNIQRKGKNRGLFDTESILMKLLPYIPHLIGGVLTVFILYILMDSLPQVLGQLKELATTLNSYKGAEVTTYS